MEISGVHLCLTTENEPLGAAIPMSYPVFLPSVKERAAEVKKASGKMSFLGSMVIAVEEHPDDPVVLLDAATKLQDHTKKLKTYVATLDATACHAAMKGGVLGIGCDDAQLIAATCTRTKKQLARTIKRYRALYDRDLRDDIKGETGGDYGRMVYYATASRAQYVSEMITLACGGLGCDETILVETFTTCTTAELRQGKKVWEDKSDKSLVDYLSSELGSDYDG